MRLLLFVFIAMLVASTAHAQAAAAAKPKAGGAEKKEAKSRDRYIKAFPAAKDGMVRYMIKLPYKSRKEEVNYRVELIVGKEMLTDGVNRVSLGGKIDTKPLKGWGFTFYEVGKLGPARSTLIGVPPGTPKVMKFVSGPSKQIRYNSRIPLMIYVPKGAEVRYRIWEAPKKTEKAEQG